MLPPEFIKRDPAPFASGGYSTVYKATFHDRPVVIKILNVTSKTEQEKLHRVGNFYPQTSKLLLHYTYSSSLGKSLDGNGFDTRTSCRS